jgi:hypothetical protein
VTGKGNGERVNRTHIWRLTGDLPDAKWRYS